MENFTKWFNIDVPKGWNDVVVRSAKVLVIVFIVRQLQDWLEAGTLDTIPNATDAILIAGGVLAVSAIHMMLVKS